MATADPNDFTAVPDEEMRPWVKDPKMDAKVNEAKNDLMTTLQAMNPTGGYEGASELDRPPQALLDFERMIAEEGDWIGDENEMDEIDTEGNDEFYEDENLEEQEPDMDLLSDPLLTGVIDEINTLSLATDDSEDPILRTVVTQNLIPQSLANRKAKPQGKSTLKNMSSIKFSPNFGGPPLHKIKALGLSTLKVPQNRNHYTKGSKNTARPSTASNYSRADNIKQAKSIMSGFTNQRPSTSSSSREVAKATQDIMAAAKAMDVDPLQMLEEIKKTLLPSEGKEEKTKKALIPSEDTDDNKDEEKETELSDAVILSPIKKKKTPKVIAETVNASILDSMAADKDSNNISSLSMSASAPLLPAVKPGNSGVPMSARSKKKSPRSVGGRFDNERPASTALGKMGIGSNVGTASKAELMFGRKRLKSIRTLRDQMMSTAGTMTAFSRNDDPEQSKLFNAAESIRMTREQCKVTMKNQKHDNTWEILVTPGYLEQVGADNVFKSDMHMNYQCDERYDRAIDPRTFDHTNGIPTSPLRVWAEDAVRSGRLPLFSSGGAIRV
jgi:hypothetical protein